MIIGLVGIIGSGKDTVAKMIQYYFFYEKFGNVDISLNKYLKGEEVYDSCPDQWGFNERKISEDSGWQIKKFATKLKEIVCILTGCTMEDLESQEFKESLLPDHLSKQGDIRTYRWLLQKIGTDLIWINSLMSEYKYHFKYCENDDEDGINNCTGCKKNGIEDCRAVVETPNWIISDVRFINEAKSIKDRKGINILITGRGDNGNHKSETELKSIPCDKILINDSTIENLYEQVVCVLKSCGY